MGCTERTVRRVRAMLSHGFTRAQVRAATGVSWPDLWAIQRGEDPVKTRKVARCPDCGMALSVPTCLACAIERLGLSPGPALPPASSLAGAPAPLGVRLRAPERRRYERIRRAKETALAGPPSLNPEPWTRNDG